MLLENKVCVVTGAASLRSIGYATAELFAEHGAKVAVVDVLMNEKVLADIKAAIEARLNRPVAVHGWRCDISQPDECEHMVQQVVEHFGTIDCLVNSAGIVKT